MKQNIARVVRGGSWFFSARHCRSAFRYRAQPDDRDRDLGFRIVSCSPNMLRAVCGGAWSGIARYCRSADRDQLGPGNRLRDLGFRVLQVP